MSEKKLEEIITLQWTGTAGIETAKSRQKELVKALKAANKVIVDISNIDDIDITGIQLLLAAKKEADASKKNFFVKSPLPASISSFISSCSINLDPLLASEEELKEAENA